MSTSTTKPRITFHWMDHSRAIRTLWQLEELGVEYDLVPYFRVNGVRAPDALKKVFPLGKAPLVEVTTDDKHKVLAESGHITNYLATHFDSKGVMSPKSQDEAEEVDFYVQMAEATLQPPGSFTIILHLAGSMSPWYIKPLVNAIGSQLGSLALIPEIQSVFDLLESVLKKRDADKPLFFVGDSLTAADIMLQWHIGFMTSYSLIKESVSTEKYPLIHEWNKQMTSRPAFVRSLEKEKKLMEDNGVPLEANW